MTERHRTLIVAGSYREFMDWCRENKRSPYDRDIRYVNTPEQLQGYKPGDVTIVRYGNWIRSPLFTGRRQDQEYIYDLLGWLERSDV